MDEWAGVCLQVASRIINYLCSSLKIINYFLVFTGVEAAQTRSLRQLEEFSGLAIRKNNFTSKLSKVDLEGRENKHILLFLKVILESQIMF